MICLILLIMLSCQSTQYIEMAGIKNELFTKREGTSINDFINNRAINRAINNCFEEQSEKQEKIEERGEAIAYGGLEGNNIKKEEVKKMDADFSSLITTITSAIAGVYCAIKSIIMFVKKIKK